MCSGTSEERFGSGNRVVESEAGGDFQTEYCEGGAENSVQERRTGWANQKCEERKEWCHCDKQNDSSVCRKWKQGPQIKSNKFEE